MYDLLLQGGTVFDGSGAPGRRCDIAIAGGRIAAMAGQLDGPARECRDVSGLWLLPGLVDIHTHYDVEVEIAPGLAESVRHGVTTVVMGNCSLSLTAGRAEDLADIFLRVESLPAELVRRWLSQAVSWTTPADYLAHLGQLKLGPNVAPLLGHSAVRVAVMGLERALRDTASDSELQQMRTLALSALQAGCCGISIDMVHWHKVSGIYAGRSVPSHYADLREYRMLAALCRERDAVFQVTPNPQKPSSFLRILAMGMGLFRPPLRLTVLSAMDMSDHPGLWRAFPLAAWLVNRVFGGNLRFQALGEAFVIRGDGPLTPFFEEFPSGVELNSAADAAARRALWADTAFRTRFRRDWQRRGLRTFHRDPARMQVLASPDPAHVGLSIGEIARRRGHDATATLMDLLAEYDTALCWQACSANERPGVLRKLLAHAHILPGFSDAGAHSRNIAFFDSALNLLREAAISGFMPMEKAVARVSGEAAQWFNIDAGRLRAGARADLLLLRPQALAQPSRVTEVADALLQGAPRLVRRDDAAAVAAVFIGGEQVVRDGEPLPLLASRTLGQVLSPQRVPADAAAALARHRNRLDDATLDHPFRDYWDIFVYKHQARGNIALHCLGVLLMHGSVVAALLSGNAWWLLGIPLSQASGLLGHLLYERSHVDMRDLVFSWRASRCLNRLFVTVLRGRYALEVRRVRALYAQFLAAQS
ncbi:N-acyl-D-aspartate/D-glutamate deacylase [Tahibacter aquaticus]|uniref:N-acyl-D-aspartate/D-glutamate deacylase n=1 Tax=Tahibacter aquaticus TaxID=520092 RepID=A0A4R6Z0S5_9GAMM|nr:Mpo1-like protein [Tahibacter aquaticus]TDR45024.1 N-acyl-D-aspartate/D-glutamate deacylase [Tahibacter aquaticus]